MKIKALLYLFALAVQCSGATVYLYNSGDNHFGPVLFRTWEGSGWSGTAFTLPWVKISDIASGGITEVFRAEVPDGIYRIDAGYYSTDGSLTLYQADDVVAKGTLTIAMQYPRTFGVSRYANEHDGVTVPVGDSSSGSPDPLLGHVVALLLCLLVVSSISLARSFTE